MTIGDVLSKYLGSSYDQLRHKMIVRDVRETGLNTRKLLNDAGLKNCWVVFMPDHTSLSVLSPSRIICVHKKTGSILFDGSEGGFHLVKDHSQASILAKGVAAQRNSQ